MKVLSNLKEAVEEVERLALDMIEIKSVEYTGIMNAEKNKDFPKLFLYSEDNITIGENINELVMGMWFCDVQISKKHEWQKDKEIKSDMMQAASKLLDVLEMIGYIETSSVDITPFSSDMNDGLAGVVVRPTFVLEKPCVDYKAPQPPTPPDTSVPYFSITIDNATIANNDLFVPFHFSPSPQIMIDKIELWVNGSIVDTRNDNLEDPFILSGISGAADVQIKAYKNGALIQVSGVVKLPVPIALPIADYTFGNTINIDLTNYISDPQNLMVFVNGVSAPNIGSVQLLPNDIVKVDNAVTSEVQFTYSAINSAGLIDSGLAKVDFAEISMAINQINGGNPIYSSNPIVIDWTMIVSNAAYIDRFDILVDGVFVQSKAYINSNQITLSALGVGAHTLQIEAYDTKGNKIEETAVYPITVASNLFLNIHPNLYGESWGLHQLDTNFTGDVIEVRRDDNAVERYGFVDGELPIAATASFVGSGGNGTISWYKGQANGLELIQPNAANQPWLFKNGVLQEEAGHPTLNFDGNQWLNGGNILNVESRDFMSIAVFNLIGGNRSVYAKSVAAGAPNRYALISNQQVWADKNNKGNNFNRNLRDELLLANQLMVSGVHYIRKNNIELGYNSGAGDITNSAYDFQIGAYNDGQGNAGGLYHAIGNISAIHIFFEDKLSELTAMNNKINERYEIY